jgi:hypothetical protein
MEDLGKKLVKGGAFIDVKAAFDTKAHPGTAGYKLWRLYSMVRRVRRELHGTGGHMAADAGPGRCMSSTASTPAAWKTASST